MYIKMKRPCLKVQVLGESKVRLYEVAPLCSVLGRCTPARDGVIAVTCEEKCFKVFKADHAGCELHVIFTLLIVVCKIDSNVQLARVTVLGQQD